MVRPLKTLFRTQSKPGAQRVFHGRIPILSSNGSKPTRLYEVLEKREPRFSVEVLLEIEGNKGNFV